ncbi:MAG: DUF4382 domain-containing protein [Filimonas sp.]|nr:DUF4382 domain-containing protein [Filimonas sp.]
MKKMQLFVGMAFTAMLSLFIVSCQKSADSSDQGAPPPGQQNVSLYMTDGPGFFDHVYIDIKSVSVLVDTSNKKQWDWDGPHDKDSASATIWANLQVKAGVYDLLALRNGTDTLLAGGNVPKGKVRLIKIELGTQNSLVKDSVTYPLNIPAWVGSTIYIRLRGDEWEEFASGRSRLWLDFDVQRSIIQVRNNLFYLNPFLRCFIVKATGSVQGKVLPKDAYPVISVYSGTDTSYALPNPSGEFKVRGLKSGTYSVFINASNGYKDTTISNVNVGIGGEAKIGTITLRK